MNLTGGSLIYSIKQRKGEGNECFLRYPDSVLYDLGFAAADQTGIS
jgi:hypothetical protein